MDNQRQAGFIAGIGGEELAGSGFEDEVPVEMDEVGPDSLAGLVGEELQ